MKKIIFAALATVFSVSARAQVYNSKTSEVGFYSAAAVENIEAKNTGAKVVLDIAKGNIAVKIPIRSFEFEKRLMKDHFNENYMESEKFPHAIFTGKINETVDYKKDGTYEVSVTGKLIIHGVEKARTIKGTITVKGGEITIDAKFNVTVKDHGIKVPEMMFQKIAETVEVTVKATLVAAAAETKKTN